MTTITASEVNKLRQVTGAGLMDCKAALTETGGDFEGATTGLSGDFLDTKTGFNAIFEGASTWKDFISLGKIISKLSTSKEFNSSSYFGSCFKNAKAAFLNSANLS